MKKSIFFFGITILSLVSCKKDYTCECYIQGSSQIVETYQLKDMRENDATAKCDSYDGTVTYGGQTANKDCVIQ